MHIDISVRTIVGALATANTPVLNDHLERIAAANRSYWTAHHAQRITALPARCGDEITIEAKSFTNQPAHPIVSIRASAHALIAASTTIEVENEQALRFHQALTQELVHGNIGDLGDSLPVLLPMIRRFRFQLPPDFREAVEHKLEIVSGNAHHLHMI